MEFFEHESFEWTRMFFCLRCYSLDSWDSWSLIFYTRKNYWTRIVRMDTNGFFFFWTRIVRMDTNVFLFALLFVGYSICLQESVYNSLMRSCNVPELRPVWCMDFTCCQPRCIEAFSNNCSLISKSDTINRSAIARRVFFDCFCMSAHRASADDTPVFVVVDIANVSIIL